VELFLFSRQLFLARNFREGRFFMLVIDAKRATGPTSWINYVKHLGRELPVVAKILLLSLRRRPELAEGLTTTKASFV
jgi:hypothetical protein